MSTPDESGASGRYHQHHGRKMSRRKAAAKRKKPAQFLPDFQGLERRMMPTTYTVMNANDSGAGSLRDAIDQSNAAGGSNVIDFDIPGSSVQTIGLASPLPAITEPVLIDGTSQHGWNGTPLIELDGTGAGSGTSGLVLAAGSSFSQVRGVVVSGFTSDGIDISSNNNIVTSCYVGTDATGTFALANGNSGIEIQQGASNNTIGGAAAGAGNLISGNAADGVDIGGSGTTGNVVQGNLIGTDATGTAALANGGSGVDLFTAASSNTIGGTSAAARNVISGNALDGIELIGGATTKNVIAGNFIGTDITGTVALGNGSDGIFAEGRTSQSGGSTSGASLSSAGENVIGGTSAAWGNVISGNAGAGIYLAGGIVDLVAANLIGTNASGTQAVHNNGDGIDVDAGASGVTIGGTTAGSGNVISGNSGGINENGAQTENNLIAGNMIGTNAAGTAAIPNIGWGVFLGDAGPNITVGGTTPGSGNVISGNDQGGVAIYGINAVGDVVEGNRIGTDISGMHALGNPYSGVYVGDWGNTGDGATDATIGGTAAGAGNVISANGNFGVWITGLGVSGNVVEGNEIGTDLGRTVALGNAENGVQIDSGASDNTIGGAYPAGNIISGNDGAGVLITGSTTSNNVVADNQIGTDGSGTVALPNGTWGVLIDQAPDNLVGGTTAATRNVVSGNDQGGIAIYGGLAVGDVVEGNYIGVDETGSQALGNSYSGVFVGSGAGFSDSPPGSASYATIGGTALGAGNVISANGNWGVWITGAGATGNVVEGNKIGTDASGTSAIANGADGVRIDSGAASNTIGGSTAVAANVISGNSGDGVSIKGDYTESNVVEGNTIGADVTGTVALANGAAGVFIGYGASYNTIGGTASGAGNLISGNTGDGVQLHGPGEEGNIVAGNLIGIDTTGELALGNNGYGVEIDGATSATLNSGTGSAFSSGHNLIGRTGSSAAGSNVISGNILGGIYVAGGTLDIVAGNFIGTDVTGTQAVANGGDGVKIGAASGITIGGVAATPGTGLGNVISGNQGTGVDITGGSDDVVLGNLIGTNAAGTSAIANGNDGVLLSDAGNMTVGGTASGSGNVISGNANVGVELAGFGATFDLIAGNLIGTDVTGTVAIANAVGVELDSGAIGDQIGTLGAGNVISGNAGDGILFSDRSTSGNRVQANLIGTEDDGVSPLGNQGDGVSIMAEPGNDAIGGTAAGAGNVIAYNAGNGVVVGYDSVTNQPSTGDSILGNSIYANALLGIELGTGGVVLNDSSGHTGPNLFQDFPVLTSVLTSGGTTTITGTLSGAADSTFDVEFFSNPAADPSGYGQGQTFLMDEFVTTDDNGNASFSFQTPSPVTVGQIVSATATDSNGNTSEFSADTVVSGGSSVYWANPNGGDWDTPSNWSTDAVPTASDDVFITIAVTSPITHNTSATDAVNSLTSSDPITFSAGSLAIGTTAMLSASLTLSGGTIDGGTIDLTGGATLVGTSSGGTLSGVTIDGEFDLNSRQQRARRQHLRRLDPERHHLPRNQRQQRLLRRAQFPGAQTVGGSGSIVFGFNGGNQINTASSGGDSGTLTIGSGITIHGETGWIGYDGGGTETPLVNQGTIAADGGGTISIYGADWSNSGTLEAENSSTLLPYGSWTDTGSLVVNSGSVFELLGTISLGSGASFSGTGGFTLVGGTIDGGTIDLTGGATLVGTSSGGTLSGVTIDGEFDLNSSSSVPVANISGGLTLNGTIYLGTNINNGDYASLNFVGAQTLGGSGAIVFGFNGGNQINTASSGGDSGTLTIGPNITIDGESGTIGYNGGGTETPLVNQGTIAADGGRTIAIYGVNSTDSGSIESSSGGSLSVNGTGWLISGSFAAGTASSIALNGTYVLNSSPSFSGAGSFVLTGTINTAGLTLNVAGSGLTFALAGGTIDGGTIDLTGGATLVGTSSGGTLSGVTVDGEFDLNSSTSVPVVNISGGLTLNGTIDLGTNINNGDYASLNFVGAQTLGGSGSIVFGFNGGNQINTASSGGDSGTLTIGPNITIDGESGTIGYNGGGTETPLVNQGTIAADGRGTISIYGAVWSNSGTLEAENSSTLLPYGSWNNTGSLVVNSGSVFELLGTISLGSGSSFSGTGGFTLLGGTIDGGTIDLTGGATLVGTSSGGTLSGVTLDGEFDVNSSSSVPVVNISGGLTLNGTIYLGTNINNGYYASLNFVGAQTLGGSGAIVFGFNGGNQINTASSGGDSGTLTIGPNITIDGESGTIGYNGGGTETPLVNQGTIAADGGRTIAIYGVNSTDSGSIESSSGGSLSVNGTGWSISGSFAAGTASSIALNGTYVLNSSPSFSGAGSFVLTGTINTAGLTLNVAGSGLTFALAGGTIDGGTIDLTGGATLVGTSSGGTLSGVTLDGEFDVNSSSSVPVVNISGGLTLNGTIDLGTNINNGYYASLNFVGAQTLGGSGSIVFGFNGGNQINTASSGGDSGTLTIGSGITIHGENGRIGYDGGGAGTPLVNQGTIAADSGGTIAIYGATMTSSGTLAASNSGTLDLATSPTNLSSGTLTGGTWSVGASSTLEIAGGTITTSAATIILGGTGASFSALSALDVIASTGSLELSGGASFTTVGNLDNAGTIDLAPGTLTVTGAYTQESSGAFQAGIGGATAGSQFGQLKVTGSASLGGALITSVINGYSPALSDSYQIMTFGAITGTFATESGLNISGGLAFVPTFGAGSLSLVVGQSTSVSWINPSGGDWDTPSNWSSGTVPNSNDDVTISIAVSNPITHNTSASDAVHSLTSSDPITLGAGSLAIGTTADLSASITLSGGTINGGTIDLTSGATLVATGSGGTLDGVTVDGNIDLTAVGANLTITDGLTLDGTAAVGAPSGNAYGYLNFAGTQTLSGTGTVVFGQSIYNTLLVSEAATTLTIGPVITVRGQTGTIGYNSGLTSTPTNVSVVNQGTIQADVAAGTITIDGTGDQNEGELNALNGTTLSIDGTVTNTGTVSVDSTSVLSLSGTLTGGTIAPLTVRRFTAAHWTVSRSTGTSPYPNTTALPCKMV